MTVGRVVWTDYTIDEELGVLVRLSVRMEDGSKFNGYVQGTEPYIFAPDDEPVPDEDYIKYTESGYESLFDQPLQRVVTETPKQADNLTNDFSWTGEADVPYYRRVAIHDGLSGYVDILESEEEYEGLPLIDIDDIDVEPEFDGVIEPRISIADIEVHVPEEGTFDDMVENADEPINVITSYDTYEEKYTVFYYDKHDNLDVKSIRSKMEEQLSGTDIESYTDTPIEILSSNNESGMLNSYIDYVNNRDFDLISGWNYVSFDREYIRKRMKTLRDEGEDIHPSWLSPFGKTSATRDEHRKIVGRPPFDMLKAFCFSGDTDILTPNGIKNIKEIDVGDEVYTLNEDTHDVEVKPVTDTYITKNRWGKLESHSGRSHDFKVTPNHRFYLPENARKSREELQIDDYDYMEYRDLSENKVPYKFPQHNAKNGIDKKKFNIAKETDTNVGVISEKYGHEFRKGLSEEELQKVTLTHGTAKKYGYEKRVGKYIMPAKIYVNNINHINEYADEIFVKNSSGALDVPVDFQMENWLKLMGWYISEGYVVKPRNELNICQQKENHRQSIRSLLEEMDLNYSSDDYEFSISGQILGKWFSENCGDGSENKTIPEWVFNLDSYYLNNLLQTLIDGDGTRPKTSSSGLVYSTVSKQLKEDIVRIGLLCGYRPSVTRHSEHEHIYQIYLSKQGGSFVKSKGESVEHDDNVYCITAKDNHTIMAGRNGKFSWIGQCDKMTFSNWRSKSLEYVSNVELGIGKIDDVDINKDWENEPSKLIAYNIVDVILTVALDDANDIHNFFYDLATDSSIPIYDTFSEKRLVDGYIMSRRNDDEVLPTVEEKPTPNAGGYVDNPVNGRFEKIGVSDLKSLYPSAMITGNISTETVSESPEDFDEYVKIPHVPEPKKVEGNIEEEQIDWEWLYASLDKEGIIPRTLKQLFDKRNSEKDKMYKSEKGSAEEAKWDRKQGATKVIMNSFYGNASSPYWRLSNEYLGNAITSFARYTLWKGRKSVEEMGYEAIYGDTDSHFIQLTRNTIEEQVEELKEISAKMDEGGSEIFDDIIGTDLTNHPFLQDSDLHGDNKTCMKWEPEKIYSVWMQLGRKKRYAGNIDWKEGSFYFDPEISISGFENQRSDSMEITAELQEEIIKKILTGAGFTEVSDYIRGIIDTIDTNNDDVKQFALPKGINKKSIYDYDNSIVRRAVVYSNEELGYEFSEGDDPFVYYVKETPAGKPNTDVVAFEWNEEIPDGFKLNKEAIIERGIHKPIDTIVNEVGWEMNELRSGKKQQTMDFGGGNPFA